MSSAPIESSSKKKPLRLWPGVVLVALQWLLWQGVPLVAPDAGAFPFLAALGVTVLLVVWWLFLSRAPWPERVGAIALMAAALAVTPRLLHASVANAGQGMLFFVYALPVLCLALVVWAAAARGLTGGLRWGTLVAAIVLACGVFTLVRTPGVSGAGADLRWRWTPTPEERLLAESGALPAGRAPAATALEAAAEWPGFRGPGRDAVVPGVKIETDWSSSPPRELWRRPIGPGWSSVAVLGDLIYTQEQRGKEELVSCYRASTGEPIWSHADPARFWEANAGAGPRATPTLHDGRVYTLGGTGLVNALDAADGSVIWSRDAAADVGREVPYWGFAGSPLVVGDAVVVAAGGRLVGYDLSSGEPRWFGPEKGGGYSSPHLVTLDGVDQIVLLNGAGVIGVAPDDGTVLWQHEWSGAGIVQPARTDDGDLVIGANGMAGGLATRRLAVTRGASGWTVEERWTSSGLKPNFNDLVVHEGHVYGFDNSILAAIDLATGERKWKGGRYGQGQMLLLPDQDLLLVTSEKGELALVSATPDRHTEIARFQALEGKTWNHPVLVGDLLLVRNSQEMAAFRLARSG